MRINRLSVKNFKGFEHKVFDFSRSIDAPPGNGSFHLIIGQNGKGKTSTLDALAVAVGSWFLGIREEDSRHIQSADVRVKVLEFGDTERIEEQRPVVVEAHGLVMGKSLRWSRELAAQRTTFKNAKNIKVEAEKAVERMQKGDTVTLPLISYYGTGRLWVEPRDMRASDDKQISTGSSTAPQAIAKEDAKDNLADIFASRLAGYRYSIDPRCSPQDLLRWLKFEQQLTVQNGRESIQFEIVKKAIRDVVKGCKGVKYHLRLGLLLDIEDQPRLPFGALSDGQRSMIAMVGDLAFKAAQLNPHLGSDVLLKTPGIVLIDELDLHLHPRWQRAVVEDLRKLLPEVQFVATTHSPFIVQTMREGEVCPLDAQPISETANRSIEELARGLMGVDRTDTSPLYETMKAKAKEYLLTLEEAETAPEEKLQAYLDRLAVGIGPYADNPAYQAFLELHRQKLIVLRQRASAGGSGS